MIKRELKRELKRVFIWSLRRHAMQGFVKQQVWNLWARVQKLFHFYSVASSFHNSIKINTRYPFWFLCNLEILNYILMHLCKRNLVLRVNRIWKMVIHNIFITLHHTSIKHLINKCTRNSLLRTINDLCIKKVQIFFFFLKEINKY